MISIHSKGMTKMEGMILSTIAAMLMAASEATGGGQEAPRLPPDVLTVAIKPEELAGYAPLSSWRSDREHYTIFSQSFYHVASEDVRNGKEVGRRFVRARYFIFHDRSDAVKDWWMFPSRFSTGFIPRGTFTGDPLGVEACWYNRGYKTETFYELYTLENTLTCSIDVSGSGTRIQATTTEEIHLAENIARKILANLKEIPFQITTGPPKDWIVMPAAVTFQGKPLEVKPKPALIEGHVYVSPPVLEALGLQVEWDEWDKNLKQITVQRGEAKMVFTLGEEMARMTDGAIRLLEVAPWMLDGFPVVPLEAVTSVFGLEVEVQRPTVERSSEGKGSDNAPTNPPQSRGPGLPLVLGAGVLAAVGLGLIVVFKRRR
jgi:hypothetical protein